MTQATPPNPAPASTDPSDPLDARDSAADTEPLLHLHKMSTTAGLGSGDYVAVNVTAVVAVLFGLASFVAKFSEVLLIIPVVGVVLSIVALWQIRNSNGTQTGRFFALAGLALSGIISAVLFINQGIDIAHRRANEAAISDLCRQFGQLVVSDQYDQAYDLFDTAFHDRVGRNAFKAHLMLLQHSNATFPIESTFWNGLAYFASDASDVETAEAVIKIQYKGLQGQQGMNMRLKRQGTDWRIDNIVEMFPPLKGGAADNARN
jgi:hypothetical protein